MSDILKQYIITELQKQTDSEIKAELLPQQKQLAQAIADSVSKYLRENVVIISPPTTVVGAGPPGTPHVHTLTPSKLQVP